MNKKVSTVLFILIIGLFLISTVNAADTSPIDDGVSTSNEHEITSDLSNDDIQSMFDNANDGDTFKFTSKEYNDVSLVVDKNLSIISEKNSIVNAANTVSDKAKSLGISKTFGFYFTSNSAGSILSGITIVASNCDNAIIVDGARDIEITNNTIVGATNSVLIKNSQEISLTGNDISKASENGVQLQDVKYSDISKNNIHNNKRSGIEINNMNNCTVLRNEIHHNKFNGISMYGVTSGNTLKYNSVHNNTNGIFIDSKTSYDVLMANTLSHSRRDPFFELGPDESGNGLLFGEHFRSKGDKSKLLVKNNALIHNEQFQAKNNPANEKFGLDQNWFDSTDGENTFVCPMLFAKILKLNAITIQDGIGIQLQDEQGNPIDDAPAFDIGGVDVDGNTYTAKVENDGIAKIKSPDIEPNTEHKVKFTVGDRIKTVIEQSATSGPERYVEDAGKSNDDAFDGDDSSSQQSDNQNTEGRVADGSGDGHGNYVNGTSSSSHISDGDVEGKYGTNSSDVISTDSSDSGVNAISKGDVNAGSSSGGSGESAKAYEVVPKTPISKSVQNTSGAVIISILALLGCFVYGYRRKEEYD